MDLTQDMVRDALDYNPTTGWFTWRKKVASKVVIGRRAGTRGAQGYRQITLYGNQVLEHRMVWFWVHGEWPDLVDHINLNKTDNRVANLRKASHFENACNARAHRDNPNKRKGIWRTKSGRWQAMITVNKKRLFLGAYGTPEEAAAAYDEAAKTLHGDFARINGT